MLEQDIKSGFRVVLKGCITWFIIPFGISLLENPETTSVCSRTRGLGRFGRSNQEGVLSTCSSLAPALTKTKEKKPSAQKEFTSKMFGVLDDKNICKTFH